MYSVFLVEDEIAVREGIRNSIPWENTQYILAGEAPDGEMALSILRDIKPDILITDIRMPFLDGLELSRVVKKTQPWVKIIILSGHDEFNYAKEAISIGVEEYLLKPVSASDMLASLAKVSGRIEEEKKRLSSFENMKQKVQSTEDILREKWLANLVTGLVNTGDAIEQARERSIDLIARSYVVAIAELDVPEEDFHELMKARSLLQKITDDRSDVIPFFQGTERLVLLIKSDKQDTLEETVYSLAQGIKYETERNTGCTVAVAIGSCTDRIAGISHSYAEAGRALRYLTASGRRIIVGINDIQPFYENEFLKLAGDPIADRLRYATRDDIDDLITQYMELIGENLSPGNFVAYYLLYDIIAAASSIVEELQGDIHDIFPLAFKPGRIAEIVASKDVFCAEVRNLLEVLIDFRDSRIENRYHAMIGKAKQYINMHYTDPDISLHSVASYVNVSPNHFSTIFSQEGGESFIEYLTRVRIDRAKQLLRSTQMKSADIAYEAGFNDPHYFSFIFKKNTGFSPREFRSEKNEPLE